MSTVDTLFLGNGGQRKYDYTVDPSADIQISYRCHLAILCEDDGTYSAIVLNLPGAGSCGASEAEAIQNAREAAMGVISSFIEDGEEIPWVDASSEQIPEGAKQKWILVDGRSS
jgi:predicted RNase H-like HicB family nuclease